MQHNIPFSVGQRKSKLEKYCALFIFHLQMIHEKWKMKIGVAPLSHFPLLNGVAPLSHFLSLCWDRNFLDVTTIFYKMSAGNGVATVGHQSRREL